MKALEFAFLGGAILAFAAGTAASAAAARTGSARLVAWIRAAAVLGILFHAALLAASGARQGHFPVGRTFEAFVFLAATMSAAALLLDVLRGLPILLVATLPLALLTSLLALALTLVPAGEPPEPRLSGVGMAFHIAGATASYAAFAIAFAGGVVYLVAQRQLKRHGPAPVLGLMPALETINRITVRSIAAGVLLLGTGLVVGYLYARHAYPGRNEWRVDPKVFLTTATVLAYAALLGLSRRPAFKGRRTALASIAGFTLVLVTFWANVFWSGFHRF